MAALPEVIAHRGASAYAPEHTLEAYDLALAQGADTLELDIRCDARGVLVVQHDRTRRRTGRAPLPLEDVLARYARDTRWLVELTDPRAATADATVAALRRHGLLGHAVVQSFHPLPLARCRRDGIRVSVLVPPGGRFASRWGRWAHGLGLHHGAVDAAAVARARAHGLRVHAWTVNEPAEMRRLLAAGVDGLITDRPDAARDVVAGRVAAAA